MRGIYDCDTTNVMECQACGLQYLFPCMSKKDEKFYYKDYYTKQKSRYSSAKSLIDIQNESYNFYEKYVNLFLDILKETSTILEIGSGAGGFIRFVKKHYKNHKIDAIERDNINIDFIKECFNDVDVQKDTIIPPPIKKYDIIFGHGVFEHIYDSRNFLVGLRRYLAKNGIIVLIVPNKYNPLVYKYDIKKFRKFAYMKQHYYTFSENSISLLAKDTNYQVQGFYYMQRYGLDNHLSWLRYKKPRNYTDMGEHISYNTMEAYDSDLIANKITDIMMFVLKR